jgi:PAS domain S-box-containing protein
MLVGAIMLLVPVLVLMGLAAWTQYGAAKQAVRTQAQSLALDLANQQERQIEAARRLLEGLLRVPALREGDPAACGALLAQLRGETASPYQNFTVALPDGTIRCVAVPIADVGRAAALPGFAEALAAREFQVGGYSFGQRAGRPNLSIIAPALNRRGEVTLLIHAALDLDWLGDRFLESRLPAGSVVSVIDRNGTVMLSRPDPGNWIGRSVVGTPLAGIVGTRAKSVFEGLGIDGTTHVQAVVPLAWGAQPTAWLHVSIPVGAAYAPLQRLLAVNVGTLALLLVLVGVAWRALSRHVLTPLHELGGVAQQIAAGERGLRATPRRDDEIGALAGGFNRMLDNLVMSQRALAQSERRWLVALEGAGLGVWDWNAQAGTVFYSRRWLAMLGYGDGDVGNSVERWSALIHPEDIARCQADRESHFRGDTPTYRNEHRIRAKDGSWRWVFDQGTVFERGPAGEPLRVVGTYTDVTERKQAEQALLEKQNALSEAQRIARLGSWSWQPSTGLVTCSEETCRLYGFASDRLVYREGELLDCLEPEDRAGLNEWLDACAAGTTVGDHEFRVRLPDGSRRVLNGRGYLQHNARGGPLAVLGTVQDVTERKALEQELDQHRNHLEGLVTSRTAELEAARAEAERLARVKSDFLANMSHEIRTPLNAVLGLARVGSRESAGREVQRTFQRIREAGEHLLGIINDVLDFSKLEAGRITIDREPLALAAVVDNVHSLVSDRAAAKGLRFTVDMARGMPVWVTGDEQRLRQILVNLLANAVKFTDRGEVRLGVFRRGDDTYFEVSDTGIGMTDEQVSRLFRSFEQADNSTTRRYGGSGLGLAISRNLAQEMGGQIEVTSTSGAGSVFTLRLPLPPCAAPRRTSEPGPIDADQRLRGLRLLAAEDVEINRLVLEDLLTSEGAEVLFAENGQEVLDLLHTHGAAAFHAVLMDIQMPVMDGYQATRALLALAPDLPVIGLTAHALGEERDRCIAAGMVEHVTKPIDADVLITAIRRHVGRPVTVLEPLPSTSTADVPTVDWAALLARYSGRQEFVTKLASTALTSHGETPRRLGEIARSGDLVDLAFLAHALKGLAGNLLARDLETLAREAEMAAREDQPAARDLGLRLADEMQKVLDCLRQRVNERAATADAAPARA